MDEYTDPIYSFVFENLNWTNLSPDYSSREFAITAEGFVPLVEKFYNIIKVKKPNFAKYISESMFMHYCTGHLYARCIMIRKYNGDSSIDENMFLDDFISKSYPLPKPIKCYLSSIGNIQNPQGSKFKLIFPAWPYAASEKNSLAGSFGCVSSDNHWKYECMPSPYVTRLRIQEDIAHSINPLCEENWDLPSEIRPCSENIVESQTDESRDDKYTKTIKPGLPTKNLLGWSPSVKLGNEQRELLEGLRITPHDFPSSHVQFQYNVNFFETVAYYLKQIERNVMLDLCLYNSENGSLSQILFCERDVHGKDDFNRSVQYCEHTIRAGSFYHFHLTLTVGSIICSFRVHKKEIGQLHSYVCYDWQNYEHVPDSWVKTANYIFEFGDVAVWNEPKLFTAYSGRALAREKWLKNYFN